MKHGMIPPTLNYDQPDPACPVNVSSEAMSFNGSAILKTGRSATGQMVSAIFEKL